MLFRSVSQSRYFGGVYKDFKWPDINIPIIRTTVEVEKPEQSIIDTTKPTAAFVPSNGRVDFGVFFDELSKRILTYKGKSVKTSDIQFILFAEVFKELYGDKYKGKAAEFSRAHKESIEALVGTRDKVLDDDDITALSNFYRGLAWNVVN